MSGGALTLDMMEQVLKKMYLPAAKEALDKQISFAKDIGATWNDVPYSAEAWWTTPLAPPTRVAAFTLEWDKETVAPVYTHTPMGFHIVSLKWAEWDGRMLHQVPMQDGYELILVADCILVPEKSGMSLATLKSIFNQQALAVQTTAPKAPPAWVAPMEMKEVRKYPRTQVYSKTIISGKMVGMSKDNPAQLATLLGNVTGEMVNQMMAFLRSRILAGAAYDWMNDPEMFIKLPEGGV